MYYRTKSVVVEATRLTAEIKLNDSGGVRTGGIGDWLVINVDGKPFFLSEEDFFRQFEACDDEGDMPTRFEQERKTVKPARTPRVKKNGLAKSVLDTAGNGGTGDATAYRTNDRTKQESVAAETPERLSRQL
jgi:hypothetical protein